VDECKPLPVGLQHHAVVLRPRRDGQRVQQSKASALRSVKSHQLNSSVIEILCKDIRQWCQGPNR